MMGIYLSGPMTGYEDWNEQAFREAEETVRRIFGDRVGHVYNPADNIREFAFLPHEEAIRLSLHELTTGERCHPKYTHLVMLDNYWLSDGAMTEMNVAKDCGISVVDINAAIALGRKEGLLP